MMHGIEEWFAGFFEREKFWRQRLIEVQNVELFPEATTHRIRPYNCTCVPCIGNAVPEGAKTTGENGDRHVGGENCPPGNDPTREHIKLCTRARTKE